MNKHGLLAIVLLLGACQAPTDSGPAASDGPTFDVVIAGGTVVDGLGTPRFAADVGIKGDRILAVSTSGLADADAGVVIDASGLIVSPGFIDNHAHIQTTIHEHPLAENFTRQGITTIIAALHSGDQPWPLDE